MMMMLWEREKLVGWRMNGHGCVELGKKCLSCPDYSLHHFIVTTPGKGIARTGIYYFQVDYDLEREAFYSCLCNFYFSLSLLNTAHLLSYLSLSCLVLSPFLPSKEKKSIFLELEWMEKSSL